MQISKTVQVDGSIFQDLEVLWKTFLFGLVPNIQLIKFIQVHPCIHSFLSASFSTCREKSRICIISSISSFLWNSQRNSKNHVSRCLISLFLAVCPTPWLFKNPQMLIQDLRSNYRENDGVIFIFGHFQIPRREK